MSENAYIILIIFMPIVAFLYASVGHGGASSYITLLTLAGIASTQVKPTALILNMAVSAIAFAFYFKSGNFNWKLFIMLAVFSIPASFFGGRITVNESLYRQILGVLLLFPIARFLNLIPISQTHRVKEYIWLPPILGLSIGLISGMIGIGGGIILSPILLLFGWTNLKETSGISALFIFVNSCAGLYAKPLHLSISNEVYLLMFLALLGGILGAYLGAKRFDNKVLKILLTIVLVVASLKLIIQ
jgi:uncharacterized membrane protein YfcA